MVIKITDTIRIYKNSKMFKDMIMISLSEAEVSQTESARDITKLLSHDTLVGINISSSELFKDESDGFIYPTADVLKTLNEYLKPYDLNFEYDKDQYLKVGVVLSVEPIENSKSLQLCDVETDGDTHSIVCGASNVVEGMKTIVALDHAILPTGVLIQEGMVLNTHSDGMLCSKRELGFKQLESEHGIIVLDDNEEVGLSFFDVDWRKYNV